MKLAGSFALATALATAATGFAAPAQAASGDAVAAGVAGFAVGMLIGHAMTRPSNYLPAPVHYAPAPWTPEWYSYCARTYPSFDPGSGTFIGYDGYRHLCR